MSNKDGLLANERQPIALLAIICLSGGELRPTMWLASDFWQEHQKVSVSVAILHGKIPCPQPLGLLRMKRRMANTLATNVSCKCWLSFLGLDLLTLYAPLKRQVKNNPLDVFWSHHTLFYFGLILIDPERGESFRFYLFLLYGIKFTYANSFVIKIKFIKSPINKKNIGVLATNFLEIKILQPYHNYLI